MWLEESENPDRDTAVEQGKTSVGLLPSSHPPERAGNVPTPTKSLSRLCGILPTWGTCWAEVRSSENTGVGTKFGARKVFTESAATNILGKLWCVRRSRCILEGLPAVHPLSNPCCHRSHGQVPEGLTPVPGHAPPFLGLSWRTGPHALQACPWASEHRLTQGPPGGARRESSGPGL